jgi:hypothetical protein
MSYCDTLWGLDDLPELEALPLVSDLPELPELGPLPSLDELPRGGGLHGLPLSLYPDEQTAKRTGKRVYHIVRCCLGEEDSTSG